MVSIMLAMDQSQCKLKPLPMNQISEIDKSSLLWFRIGLFFLMYFMYNIVPQHD